MRGNHLRIFLFILAVLTLCGLSNSTQAAYACGDANDDGSVNVGDAVFVINFVFKGGPGPNPGCCGDCPANLTDCGGNCVNTDNDEQHCGACGTQCPPGTICQNGVCVFNCPPGQTECGGLCVDTGSDENHCGSCNTPCPPGTICQNGSCVLNCPPGQTDCSGQCVDTSSDENNCGSCNTVCPPGTYCQAGTCVTPASQIQGDGTSETTTSSTNPWEPYLN